MASSIYDVAAKAVSISTISPAFHCSGNIRMPIPLSSRK